MTVGEVHADEISIAPFCSPLQPLTIISEKIIVVMNLIEKKNLMFIINPHLFISLYSFDANWECDGSSKTAALYKYHNFQYVNIGFNWWNVGSF